MMFLWVIVVGLVYGIIFGFGLIVSFILIGVWEDKWILYDLIVGIYVIYVFLGEEEFYIDE